MRAAALVPRQAQQPVPVPLEALPPLGVQVLVPLLPAVPKHTRPRPRGPGQLKGLAVFS